MITDGWYLAEVRMCFPDDVNAGSSLSKITLWTEESLAQQVGVNSLYTCALPSFSQPFLIYFRDQLISKWLCSLEAVRGQQQKLAALTNQLLNLLNIVSHRQLKMAFCRRNWSLQRFRKNAFFFPCNNLSTFCRQSIQGSVSNTMIDIMWLLKFKVIDDLPGVTEQVHKMLKWILHIQIKKRLTWMCLVLPLQDNVDLGDLMFSLCYLPTAGRLTITMIKARNLKAMDITGASGN